MDYEEVYDRLINIYEALEAMPEGFEIRLQGSRFFHEIEYMSLSPVHRLAEDEIALQLDGFDIIHCKRNDIVELRYPDGIAD